MFAAVLPLLKCVSIAYQKVYQCIITHSKHLTCTSFFFLLLSSDHITLYIRYITCIFSLTLWASISIGFYPTFYGLEYSISCFHSLYTRCSTSKAVHFTCSTCPIRNQLHKVEKDIFFRAHAFEFMSVYHCFIPTINFSICFLSKNYFSSNNEQLR